MGIVTYFVGFVAYLALFISYGIYKQL